MRGKIIRANVRLGVSNKMKNKISTILLLVCFMAFGCDNPKSPGMAEAWQKNMHKGLVPGYTGFTAQWLDSDIAAYIFSYKCPSSLSSKEVFSVLKKQIDDFFLESQSETTLLLRKKLSYSGPGGFDEWQFCYDENTNILTALFANLDSETERTAYSSLVERLKHYHQGEIDKTRRH